MSPGSEIGPLGSQPTYEELKPHGRFLALVVFASSQPTYEELKQGRPLVGHQICPRSQPTYEELKRVIKGLSQAG